MRVEYSLRTAFFVCGCSLKRASKESAGWGYINQFTNALAFIRSVLFYEQIYDSGSKFDGITVHPNNLIKTQMQSYIGNYF